MQPGFLERCCRLRSCDLPDHLEVRRASNKNYRTNGNSDLKLSEICCGTMRYASKVGEMDDKSKARARTPHCFARRMRFAPIIESASA